MKSLLDKFELIATNKKDQEVIDQLLSLLSDEPESKSIKDTTSISSYGEPIEVFQLVGIAIQKLQEKEVVFNTNKRKHLGIYYTDYSIAKELARESIRNIEIKDIHGIKFLEPCVGGGIFIIAYIDSIIEKFGINAIDIQNIINNIYYSDIDEIAVSTVNRLLPLYISKVYKRNIVLNKENHFTGDLLFNTKDIIHRNDPRKIFKVPQGFDVIITNPPYRLLKANSDKYGKDEENAFSAEVKNIVDYIRKSNVYLYNSGTLNLYKLFVEEIVENYSHKNSKIGLLIPNTILNDKQSELLRKRILNNYSIKKMYILKEKNIFFPEISQSLIFFNIDKSKHSNNIEIINDIYRIEDMRSSGNKVDINIFNHISKSMPVITETETGFNILRKMAKHNKICSYPNILNMRGELDLTFHKKHISKDSTIYKLIRGVNVDEFSLKGKFDFVDMDFINSIKSKREHIQSERICCQQISNLNSKKRVKFCYVPKNMVLANSCNYISISKDLFNNRITIYYLLGILNSNLIDWRFKLTSSNNHISNYEISELPIPLCNEDVLREIEELSRSLIKGGENDKIKTKLNSLVYSLFDLTDQEINYIEKKYNDQ